MRELEQMMLFGKGNSKTGVKVGDLMTRNFVFVSPDSSLIECAKEMIKKHVGSVIVKENQELRGIIGEKDIVWAVVKRQDLTKLKARDIMAKRVVSISPSKDVTDALSIMKRTRYKHLPVTVKNKVIGLITVKDILRLEPSLFGSVQEVLLIKEEADKLRMSRARRDLSDEVWVKEGTCVDCGAYGLLYNVDGRLLCESCNDIK